MNRALLIIATFTLVPACVHAHDEGSVPIADPVPTPRRARTLVDLSALKLFRNAFVVTDVGPYEQHFTVWYHHIEPAFEQLRVHKDPVTGKIHIAVDNGMWGGIGAPPNPPKAPPPDIAPLQRELEEELRARAPAANHWVVEYEGNYRTVTLQEMMPTSLEGTTTRVGWNGSVTLEADAALTHLSKPTGDYQSGFGMMEAAEPLQWVSFSLPPQENGTKLLIDAFLDAKSSSPEKSALTEAALAAARRFDSHAAGPTIAEIAKNQGDSLLPTGIDQKLYARLSFYARPRQGIPFDRQQQIEVPVGIRMNQAAYGIAEGTREGILGGSHFKVTASLTPRSPLTRDPLSASHKFEGSLHIIVVDDHGHGFDRTYPASGNLLVDGTSVVAPGGLSIPGSSGPSREMDALHATFPGQGDYASIDMYLTAGVEPDPRERY